MAFMYPSLMALTVNRVDDRERPAAISSFTMFFEIGTVSGGLLLGVVAELAGKRASFAAAVVVCVAGLWLLRTRVAPADRPGPGANAGPRPRLRLTGSDDTCVRSAGQLDTESAHPAAMMATWSWSSPHACRSTPTTSWRSSPLVPCRASRHGTAGRSTARSTSRTGTVWPCSRRRRRGSAPTCVSSTNGTWTTPCGAIRRLLDLDADPVVIDGALDGDAVLGPLVRRRPGLRVPGSVDPFETAVRAVVGQQISVAGARTVAGRIVAAAGTPLTIDGGPVTHVFPSPAALAAIDVESLPMPRSRGRTIVELAGRVARGELVLDADRADVAAALLDVPGVGPWTVGYVMMRGLGDPDVFLPTDLGVRAGLAAVGATAEHAERWRPWRSYALHHLWAVA